MIHKVIKPSDHLEDLFCSFHVIKSFSKDRLIYPLKAGPKSALAICFSGSYYQERNGKPTPFPHLSIIGPVLNSASVIFNRGDFGIILAEFSETGYYSLFGTIPQQLVNSFVDLTECASPRIISNAEVLVGELKRAGRDSKRIRLLEDFLRSLGAAVNSTAAGTVKAAVKIIKNSVHTVTIPSLAEKIEVSTRTLQRQFKAVTGLTPKQYADLTRFTKLFDFLMSGERVSLMKKLHSLGYYDQAHAIREFNRYAGFSPKKIAQERFQLAANLSRRFARSVGDGEEIRSR